MIVLNLRPMISPEKMSCCTCRHDLKQLASAKGTKNTSQ